MSNTTEYDCKQIRITTGSYDHMIFFEGGVSDAAHAVANCARKLIVFEILVPKPIWSWVAMTTRMFNAQKLTHSTGFAVLLRDVTFVIADWLWGWR